MAVHVHRVGLRAGEVRAGVASAVVVLELEVGEHRPAIRQHEDVGLAKLELTTVQITNESANT